MNESTDLVVVAVVLCATLVLFVGGLAALLVASHNRRIRHRAELAELHLRQNKAVMEAEREAVRHTLREVGRDLHDSTAQMFSAANYGLEDMLMDDAPDERLKAVHEALGRGIEEVRRLGHMLSSDRWRDRSLNDAISEEATRLERLGRMRAHVLQQGPVPALPPEHSMILYRVFQEAVNNAMKHSGADTLRIELRGLPGGGVRMLIADNGVGFDPAVVRPNGGLVNMPVRCAVVGYAARLTTAPGHGCIWTIEPLSEHGTNDRPGR